MKKIVAAFFCGVGVTIAAVCAIYYAFGLPQNISAPQTEAATTETAQTEAATTSLGIYGVGYYTTPFHEIAVQVREENIEPRDDIRYLDDAPWVPDWGFYNNAELVEREVGERTDYYSETTVRHWRKYYYMWQRYDETEAVAEYIRLLYQSGYEVYALGENLISYHKDGKYIALIQVQDKTFKGIIVSTNDSGYGV